MVQLASSPASPVTIAVSSGGKGGRGSRSMGLTSPIQRTSLSNNPNSPISSSRHRAPSGGRYCTTSKEEAEVSSEFISYTVHIPPNPHQPMSASLSSLPEDSGISEKPKGSFISGTIFTGGFNSVTRGHVVESSNEQPQMAKSMGMFCGMKGCDGKPLGGKSGMPCECGFKICEDCYVECLGSRGKCPGCKVEYRDEGDQGDESESGSGSEAEDRALPLPSMAEFKPDKATFSGEIVQGS